MSEEYERVYVLIHVPNEIEERLLTQLPYFDFEELIQEFASKLEQTINIYVTDGKPVRVGASFIFVKPVISTFGALDDPARSSSRKVKP